MIRNNADATSPAHGVLLLVAITFTLAALVLLMLPSMDTFTREEDVPAIFKITEIRHINDEGKMVEDGWVVLKNTGSADYKNWNLFVLSYVNGKKIPAEIPTLNAYQVAHTVNHHGIEYLYGHGSSGTKEKQNALWVSGASLAINYNNHSIRPGDVVTIEVYDSISGKIISRDTFPHTEESKEKGMMREYLSQLVA